MSSLSRPASSRFEPDRAGARRTLEIPGTSHAAVPQTGAVAELILEAARLPAVA
jgi:hypothetical protein